MKNFIDDGNSAVTADYDDDVGYKNNKIIILSCLLCTRQEVATDVESDPGMQEEAGVIHHVLTQMSRYQEDRQQNMGQKWKLPPNGQPICLFSGNNNNSSGATRSVIRMDDDSEQNNKDIDSKCSNFSFRENIHDERG